MPALGLIVVILGLPAVYLWGLDNALIFDDEILANGELFERYGSLFDIQQRMLSYGSFVWIEALFGEGWWKQRLFNLLIHIGVVLALFAFFDRLTALVHWPEDDDDRQPTAASRRATLTVGVLLFAFNPVAVYAVAYLIQRSILMATLFTVLGLWLVLHALLTERWRHLALALICYVLAVFSKEHAIMAPLLALVLYVFVRHPSPRRLVGIALASLAAVAVAGGFFVSIYGSILGQPFDEYSIAFVRQLEAISPTIDEQAYALSLLNQAWLFFKYGFFWAVPYVGWLSIDLRPPFPTSFLELPQLLGAIAFPAWLLGATWLLLRGSERHWTGFIGLCMLFPALLFFTEFSTVWIQDPFVLYRSYLWAIALPGLVVLLLIDLRPITSYAIGAVLVLLFAGMSVERVLSMRDPLHVWSDAIAKVRLDAPPEAVGRWRPFVNRGAVYLENFAPRPALADFDRAEALGEPTGMAQFNRGNALVLMERPGQAVRAFNLAQGKGFDYPQLYFDRGRMLLRLGQPQAAWRDFDTSLAKTDPDELTYWRALERRASTALQLQRYQDAIADFERLLERYPETRQAKIGIAMARINLDQPAQALPLLDEVIEQSPEPGAFYGRAVAHHALGNRQQALDDIDQAIRLQPANSVFVNLRQRILQSRTDTDDAGADEN